MNEFPNQASEENLLPKDGELYYFGEIFKKAEADQFFQNLMNTIAWKNDEVVIFGKHITTKRKTAWYGEKDLPYTYSGKTRETLPWTPELLKLKGRIEELSGAEFNSCLLNLYHSGEEGMAWHSDNERELGKEPVIASVSFGAERKFVVKHRATKEKVEIWLEHGSLLVMGGNMQDHWQHSLPKTKKVQDPRINLTFRKILRK